MIGRAYDEPESPHGVFKIYDEAESQNEGGLNRNGHMTGRVQDGRGMFMIYDEPESPHEGACLS